MICINCWKSLNQRRVLTDAGMLSDYNQAHVPGSSNIPVCNKKGVY